MQKEAISVRYRAQSVVQGLWVDQLGCFSDGFRKANLKQIDLQVCCTWADQLAVTEDSLTEAGGLHRAFFCHWVLGVSPADFEMCLQGSPSKGAV